jgi:hypothetical protein
MPNVTIINGGPTGATEDVNGQTYYYWAFTVNVNGQVGVFGFWADTNDPAALPIFEQGVIDQLQQNPGLLGGISQSDNPDNDDNDDDDDDSAVASSDDGSGGDYGDSV